MKGSGEAKMWHSEAEWRENSDHRVPKNWRASLLFCELGVEL